ncbi:nitroreductase family deazaflavin-dependent oxidoreductase [Actinophytocola sp.]|uniref:nitroreductase family deazaflavin-dependent oxidoreductase n=1 Tax=Actinophytocola sp. TaxID=1872138 RepID=UPI002D80D237|nr:nitroreductase family deazaflavin-dependent oxidoreductase [Actinophytocola sp.]HET9139367.1 nitroreductase family deazaflavin-dependent oxidoreductase [Actinophytocola sp.]HEU5108915.1 nitroreductase family deazaflavin-dependent oxidoreductase [Micromonosporaceae bacterium]
MAWSRGLARFNKKVTNRVQGLWAPYLPPWAMIVHRGRRSGREYRTPVLARRSGESLEVVLFYGERADWVRNVLAAGGAGVVRKGRTADLVEPRVVDSTDPGLSRSTRRVAGRNRRVLVVGLR